MTIDIAADSPSVMTLPAVAQTVVSTMSDDSVDSSTLADVSQNSVNAGSAGSDDVVHDDRLSTADMQSTAIQARELLISLSSLQRF